MKQKYANKRVWQSRLIVFISIASLNPLQLGIGLRNPFDIKEGGLLAPMLLYTNCLDELLEIECKNFGKLSEIPRFQNF